MTLLSQPQWITRTVESVSFVDRQTVRRRISRHFVLPSSKIRPDVKSGVLLPVFGVPKGQFISCDLKDEDGHFVSLPAHPERAHYSADVLCLLAARLDPSLDATARHLVADLAVAGPIDSHGKLESAESGVLSHLFKDHHFKLLATYFAHNYLVYVDVPQPTKGTPARHIIRFELDAMIPRKADEELEELRLFRRFGRPGFRWRPRRGGRGRLTLSWIRRFLRFLGLGGNPYTHIIPVDGAGSLHLDVEAADGVAFGERHLRFYAAHADFLSVKYAGASLRRARFLIPRGLGKGSAALTINVRPATGLLRDAAFVLAIGFGVRLYIVYRNYGTFIDSGGEDRNALLLVIPGLVSFVTARPGKHPYASNVLFGVRLLAVLPLFLGIVAALSVLVGWPKSWLLGCAIAAVVSGAILMVGRVIDAWKLRPKLNEWVAEDLTRVG